MRTTPRRWSRRTCRRERRSPSARSRGGNPCFPHVPPSSPFCGGTSRFPHTPSTRSLGKEHPMSAVPIVAAYALQEALRRRVFLVVLVLTAGFLGLFWLGADKAFEEARELRDPSEILEIDVAVGATLLGLAMFATLFLGTVLAVFLTLGAVRGDAERGLLQPLVVRPVGRSELLAGRFLAAAGVCAVYVAAVYTAAMLITAAAGGWGAGHL